MTTTLHQPIRRASVVGLSIVAALTLASCAGGPPALNDISESARQAMDEATSYTYTISDPDGVHGDEIISGEFSGQTDQVNFDITFSTPDADMEVLAVDESTSFLKMSFKDEALQELLGGDETAGKWLQVPSEEQEDLNQFTDEFESINETTFSLIEGLSEEELETVEVEETELDGQSVYKYVVPATADNNSDLYTGAESVAFYFATETSELLQVDATSGDKTAVHAFSDFNEVDLFEAPPAEDITDLEWTF